MIQNYINWGNKQIDWCKQKLGVSDHGVLRYHLLKVFQFGYLFIIFFSFNVLFLRFPGWNTLDKFYSSPKASKIY